MNQYEELNQFFIDNNIILNNLTAYNINAMEIDNHRILIIPTSHPDGIKINFDTLNEDTTGTGIFNLDALNKTDALIITNTIIETLMVLQSSQFNAISAANFKSNKKDIIKDLENAKNFYIYISSDVKDAEKISSKLKANGKKVKIINFAAPYTSIRERVINDSAGFNAELKATPREPDKLFYSDYAAANDLQLFKDTIKNNKERQLIKTGYTMLDNFLGGGLYSGLYVIAAGTGAGKTTLALNIANNIAEQKSQTIDNNGGADILYFSLEMSKNELIARSISKISHQQDNKHALTENEILYTSDNKQVIYNALNEYEYIARNFYIFESVGQFTINQVKSIIENYKTANPNKPVIAVIDYLQLLAPSDTRFSDKQNADNNILELKRISRDLEIPILVISSINRGGYEEPITLQAIKESGGIEFCASVVIGIQPNGMDYTKQPAKDRTGNAIEKYENQDERRKRIDELIADNSEKAANGEPIEMQIKILKNRAGNKGTFVLNYWPKYNRYSSIRKATLDKNKKELKEIDGNLPF